MPRTTADTIVEHAARARCAYSEERPVRAAVRRGDVSIATLMREQPVGLADRTLFEILLMAHTTRPSSHPPERSCPASATR